MNTRHITALCAALALTAAARAGSDIEDKLGQYFYPPELIMKSHQLLNPTEEQKNTLKEAYESAQQKIGQAGEKLREEVDKFIELSKQRHVDEKALLEQGDKVLAAENEVKRVQLQLVITIKNTLTPEQQTTLNGIKSLEAKIKQAQQLGDKWKAAGRDLSWADAMKHDFESLLRDGKVSDAEALLDKVLAKLNEGAK